MPPLDALTWQSFCTLTDTINQWQHWEAIPTPEQTRYGFWYDTITGARWNDDCFDAREWVMGGK